MAQDIGRPEHSLNPPFAVHQVTLLEAVSAASVKTLVIGLGCITVGGLVELSFL